MKRIVIIAAVSFLILISGCAKDLISGKTTLNYYGVEGEGKLGQTVLDSQMKALNAKNVKLDAAADPKEYAQLQRVVARLGAVSHYSKFPYEAHLADVDVVNAWCAPGGKIMVYTGLWDPKKGLIEKGNEDELAAVLAHEIAHATARHVTEAISRNITIMMVGTAAQSAISAGGSVEGANLFGQIFADGMNIFVPSYSRKNEKEADRLGLMYMAEAGYDPRAAVLLWKKAYKRKKDRTNIYASHPASGERAAELEKLLPEAMKVYEETLAKEGKKIPPPPVEKTETTERNSDK